MKSFILSMLLFTSLANANSQLEIKDFNFEYTDPSGHGSSDKLDVRVERIDKDFNLHLSGDENGEFILKDAPGLMTDAERMKMTDLDLIFSETLNLSLASAEFSSRESSMNLNGFSLNCNRTQDSQFMDQLITGCIQKMNLRSSVFTSEGVKVSAVELKTNAGKYDYKGNQV